MVQRIELPGGVQAEVREPSPELEALNQVIMALNTIAGQLDMLLRLEVGATPSHEVKSRFRKFDERNNAIATSVVQKSNSNEETETDNG